MTKNIITEGIEAPIFSLPSQDNTVFSLAEFKNKKNVVLYFYPKDNTSGCTLQAQGFRDLMDRYHALDTIIVGISKDSINSHIKFAKAQCLPFTLVSDEESDICEKYGVWQEKSMYGKKYMGIERTTFLINKSGIVNKIWHKVKVNRHAMEVLEFISELVKQA